VLAAINERSRPTYGRNLAWSSGRGDWGGLQFMPSSGPTYWRDANGRRHEGPLQPKVDAIFAAGRYLAPPAAEQGTQQAIFATTTRLVRPVP